MSIPRFGQQILDVAQRQRVPPYIITTRQMTSGELLKYLNEFSSRKVTTTLGLVRFLSDTAHVRPAERSLALTARTTRAVTYT
jgi:hypothetical protein